MGVLVEPLCYQLPEGLEHRGLCSGDALRLKHIIDVIGMNFGEGERVEFIWLLDRLALLVGLGFDIEWRVS